MRQGDVLVDSGVWVVYLRHSSGGAIVYHDGCEFFMTDQSMARFTPRGNLGDLLGGLSEAWRVEYSRDVMRGRRGFQSLKAYREAKERVLGGFPAEQLAAIAARAEMGPFTTDSLGDSGTFSNELSRPRLQGAVAQAAEDCARANDGLRALRDRYVERLYNAPNWGFVPFTDFTTPLRPTCGDSDSPCCRNPVAAIRKGLRPHCGAPCACVLCEIPRNDGWGEDELKRRIDYLGRQAHLSLRALGVWLTGAKKGLDHR